MAMLARLLLAATCSWVVALGELCEFPADHPIQHLAAGETFQVHPMGNNQVYVYTDRFGDCHGCVRALNFCYRLHSNEELMTVEIRQQANYAIIPPTLAVTVNSTNDRINCGQRYTLNHAYCCVEQTLTEPFVVDQNRCYALRFGNTQSLLLRHSTETVNGRQEDLNGHNISGSVYKPLFYFIIDPSGDDCSNIPSTATPVTPNSSPTTETTSDTTTGSSTDSAPETTTESSASESATDSSSTDGAAVPSTSSYSMTPTSTPPPTHPPAIPPPPTEHGVDTAAQSGDDSSSSSTAPVAGVVAALLSIIMVLVVVVVVALLCLRKRQRQRKVVVSRAGEETGGILNLVYGATGGEKMNVSLSTSAANPNTYWNKGNPDMKHQYEHIEDLPSKTTYDDVAAPYIYASADTLPQGQILDTSYAAIGAESIAGKRPSLHYEVDSIYEAPANSENGLYAQFEKIKIATIPRNAIEATECLGSGQFGTVNRGVWQSPTSALEVAIKTLKSSAKEEDRVKFLQEGAIMGQFRHPNVVRLHGIVREQTAVLLVIELLAKADLREHLITLTPEEGEGVDSGLPHTLLSYCRQVISGLAYLAKKGFVHRDIAARNILLSEDQETCKIADFGMSRDLADETYYISRGGKIPVKWTAPEALHYKKYSTASDVWSFGCLMYEIWSLGHKPFMDFTNVQAIKMVDGGNRLAPPPGCPRAIYQLMINCWNPTASERPSADSVSQSLARSDPVLLKWEVSDKPAGVPQALQLGGPLDSTSLLYPDLQRAYLPPDLTDNDYEEPED